ncbi:MAG: rhamnulokinase, partial [Thermomicrobiales bacterium]
LYAREFAAPPASIGIDTWAVDFALLDAAGQLLGNPVHYRDERPAGMMEEVCEQVPRAEIFARTGIQFMPINTLYQLYALTRAGDPQLATAGTLLMVPDLFNYWLTGRTAAEYTNATTTQFFNATTRDWDRDLLAQLGLPAHLLPEVVQPGTVLGELLPAVAAEVGLPGGVPVIAPATHDTGSAVAAIPGLDARSAYISSGTWSLLGVEAPTPVLDERALAHNFTNEGGVAGAVRLLKNITGLWLLEECRRQWQREGRDYSWDDLLDATGRAAPFRSLVDPDAPDFANPPDMPAALRAYCARTGQPTPEEPAALARCCLESVALKYRVVLAALEELVGHRLDIIRVVGGGSQNRLLCQLTADCCQRPVVAGPVEATALGNILLQAIATGQIRDLAAGRAAIADSVTLTRYEPHSSSACDAASARFAALLG